MFNIVTRSYRLGLTIKCECCLPNQVEHVLGGPDSDQPLRLSHCDDGSNHDIIDGGNCSNVIKAHCASPVDEFASKFGLR